MKRNLAISAWGEDPAVVESMAGGIFIGDILRGPWNLVPIGSDDAEFFLAIEHHRQNFSTIKNKVPLNKRILVTTEPRMVNPDEYRKSVRNQYGSVFVRSEMQRIHEREISYGNGGLVSRAEAAHYRLEIPESRLLDGEIGFINENKSSFVGSSFYKFRKNLIRALLQQGLEVNVAGVGWGIGQFETTKRDLRSLAYAISSRTVPDLRMFSRKLPTGNPLLHLHGRVPDAVFFLSKFKYSLVIENEMTYVSEKLFNAILSGSIPLYVGPKLESLGIPNSLAIEMPHNIKDFVAKFHEVRFEDHTDLLETGRQWVHDDSTFNRWSMESMSQRLANGVLSTHQLP